jgi:hypothetical protein
VQAGLISRKSELEEIAQQIGQVDERIEIMSERLDTASAEMEHLEEVQQELRILRDPPIRPAVVTLVPTTRAQEME